MYCKKCGTKNENISINCSYCNASLIEEEVLETVKAIPKETIKKISEEDKVIGKIKKKKYLTFSIIINLIISAIWCSDVLKAIVAIPSILISQILFGRISKVNLFSILINKIVFLLLYATIIFLTNYIAFRIYNKKKYIKNKFLYLIPILFNIIGIFVALILIILLQIDIGTLI